MYCVYEFTFIYLQLHSAICHDVNNKLSKFLTMAPNCKSKQSDYISNLWKQQRELLNRELLLTQRTENSYSARHLKSSAKIIGPGYEFKSRVKPAFERGRTLLLAVDPEKHIQLEQERLAVLQRRTRPKSPIKLEPLDVKPLQAANDTKNQTLPLKLSTAGESSNNQTVMRSSPNITFTRQPSLLPIHHKSKKSEVSILQTLKKTRKYLDSDTKLGANTRTANTVGESVTKADNLVSSNLIKLRKPLPRKSILTDHHLALDMTHQSALEIDSFTVNSVSTDPLFGNTVHLCSESCCDSMDEDCTICSKYGSKLPIIPVLTLAGPACYRKKNDEAPSASERAPENPKNRKTLVVQLPDINCKPATPASYIKPEKVKTHTLPLSEQKTLKQKQLRHKELENLFSDITELNQVNEKLVAMLDDHT